ncbi:hypothetical protein GCM10027297_04470 [Parahaliea aestuarii]
MDGGPGAAGCQYPAFDGHFELNYSSDSSVCMAWRHGEYYCRLFVDLNFNTSTITYRDLDADCEAELDVH